MFVVDQHFSKLMIHLLKKMLELFSSESLVMKKSSVHSHQILRNFPYSKLYKIGLTLFTTIPTCAHSPTPPTSCTLHCEWFFLPVKQARHTIFDLFLVPKASACVRCPTCTLPDLQTHESPGDTESRLPND